MTRVPIAIPKAAIVAMKNCRKLNLHSLSLLSEDGVLDVEVSAATETISNNNTAHLNRAIL